MGKQVAGSQYPSGQLNEHDEGALQVKIAADPKNKKVMIDFGKPVTWIGLDPDQAIILAGTLCEKAKIADPNIKV